MSRHISEIYTDEIRKNLRPLFANWQPDQPVKLGDFGKLQGNIFIRLGSVSQFGITFAERSDSRGTQQFFSSKGTTDVKFNAAGSAPAGGTVNVKANVEINFSSEESVFFNAADCKYSMIADKVALGAEVMKLKQKDKWKRSWVVVTDVVESGATTLAVSGSSSSSIILEATGNVPNIDLADASVGFTIKSARNVGFQLVAAKGLTPLIALSQIKSPFPLWFGEGGFQPLSMTIFGSDVVRTLQNTPEVKTEESEEELYFGQIVE
jgi:hypothetical protein